MSLKCHPIPGALRDPTMSVHFLLHVRGHNHLSLLHVSLPEWQVLLLEPEDDWLALAHHGQHIMASNSQHLVLRIKYLPLLYLMRNYKFKLKNNTSFLKND